jgi:hypothetical protein
MTEKKKVNKIDPKIAPVLEAFLAHNEYQTTFKDMAFALGYKGDDDSKIKEILFIANEAGDIGFMLSELNDMFFEFQLIHKILNTEIYANLLEKYPERKGDVVKLAKRIIRKEEITNEDVKKLFKDE